MIFNMTGQPEKVLPVRRIEDSKKKKGHQISLTPESYRQVKQNKTKELLKCEKLLLII